MTRRRSSFAGVETLYPLLIADCLYTRIPESAGSCRVVSQLYVLSGPTIKTTARGIIDSRVNQSSVSNLKPGSASRMFTTIILRFIDIKDPFISESRGHAECHALHCAFKLTRNVATEPRTLYKRRKSAGGNKHAQLERAIHEICLSFCSFRCKIGAYIA